MKPPSIEQLLNGIPSSLGSCGAVLREIEAELRSPQCSLSTVGAAIEKDPDLTSRLLRLGNSPFYGYTSRLTSVAEAISLIGIQRVQDLLQASSIIERFSGVEEKYVNMQSFWRHSLACGIAARVVAMELRLPKPDKFFVAGLLHDVGRLVLLGQSPDAAQQVFVLYNSRRMLLREAEMKVLGFDHQQIGGALLRHWKYPVALVGAVASHHHPAMAEVGRQEASVVHFCDYLVNAMQIGCSGEQYAPPLSMKVWEGLHLPLETVSSIVGAVDDQIDAVLAAFLRH
jgi:putative nucleotidyltransferase with HDIG domain